MSLNDINLLSLTAKKAAERAEQEATAETATENKSLTQTFDDMDLTALNSSPKSDLCGNLTDEEIVAYMDNLNKGSVSQTTSTETAFVIRLDDPLGPEVVEEPVDPEDAGIDVGEEIDYSETEEGQEAAGVIRRAIAQSLPNPAAVKSAIHAYRHAQMSGQSYQVQGINSSYNGLVTLNKTMTASSYGRSFDTMFADMSAQLGLTKTNSIPRSALFEYTQMDSREDANMDLYGALNLAFAHKEEITYKDLQLFFCRIGGSDGSITFSEYEDTVDAYADILQSQYENMSTNNKFNFIVQKTREYLQVAGLTLQEQQLERLLAAESESHYTGIAGQGQIQFRNLGGNKLGQYNFGGIDQLNTNSSGENSTLYLAAVYNTDVDDAYGLGDLGITLRSEYLTNTQLYKWYDVVQTLVHELTHATAMYYVTYTGTYSYTPSQAGLDYMKNLGIITQSEYNNYLNNWDSIYAAKGQAFKKFVFLQNTMWGEYAAYLQTTNVYDSYAGDIFNTHTDAGNGYYHLNIYNVDGSNEIAAIKQHISMHYSSQEPMPTDLSKYKNIGYLG